jgi:hypothetical protein
MFHELFEVFGYRFCHGLLVLTATPLLVDGIAQSILLEFTSIDWTEIFP